MVLPVIEELSMLIKRPADINASEITDRKFYRDRRRFLGTATSLAVAASVVLPDADAAIKLGPIGKSRYNVTDKLTSRHDVTTYNNFYEFGTDKSDPAENAKNFKTEPWTVTIDGEVK